MSGRSIGCWRRRALVLGIVVAFLGSVLAADSPDPFGPANAAKPVPVVKGEPAKAPKVDPTAALVKFEMTVEPAEGRRGQTVRLTITGTPKTGYHTYPLTQRSDDPLQDPSSLDKLIFDPPPGLIVLEPIVESQPEFTIEKAGGVLLEHSKPFTWAADVLVLPDAKVGEIALPFTIKLQACNDSRCVPGQQLFALPIRIAELPALSLTPELQKRLAATKAEIAVVPVPASLRPQMSNAGKPTTPEPGKKPVSTPAEPEIAVAPLQTSFLHQLLLAMGAGFIMLLTPCVFPMIPVTVSFFLKQGEKEHNSPLILATVYSGTILVVLTLAVLVLGTAIQQWASNEWLNFGMGLVLLIFALSLFGMFELELPHFLTRFTSAHEGTGYLGAFFMALTFTINSFTCTGPFLGPLLATVKEMKLNYFQLVVSALAYSAAFAAPFFLLALFPRLLKSLPRSGGWLNVVKVVMGFVELALAMKFFSITDAGLFPGNPRFFNYETVLCTWMALAVACGLYLFGVFRLPHDTPVEHIGVPRLMMATFCFGLAVYMTPLLVRKAPLGAVGGVLIAWLPQDSSPLGGPSGNESGSASAHLDWTRDYEKAWEEAKRTKKLLFIDFTGVNCQNCRWNEANIFPRPDVRAEMAKFVRVQLYTDGVPDSRLTSDQAKREAERNKDWQENTFGDVSLPLYAILDPAGDAQPFTEDNKLAGQIKGRSTGTINNLADFIDMMKKANGQQVAARK